MWFIVKPLLRRPLMPLLIVLQVALACAIACNGLFLLQQKLGPILAPSGVRDPARVLVLSSLYARGRPWSAARLRAVQTDLRVVPDVQAVTYATTLPMLHNIFMTASGLHGPNPRMSTSAGVYVGDNLIDTLGLKLLAGRDFTSEEESVNYGGGMGFHRSGPTIITQALADHLFPDGHAIGQLIQIPGGTSRTVVGVVATLMRNDSGQGKRNLGYTMLFPGAAKHWARPVFAARVADSNEARACRSLLKVIHRELGPRMATTISRGQCQPFSELREKALAPQRAAVWLLSGVTLVVLIVTLTGIMGMSAYRVQQQRHTIGIKRALGAKRRDIVRELLVENLVLVGLGVVIGLIAAYGISLWLVQHFQLLRLPAIYVFIGALLLLVLGQLAVLTPAVRASHVPPSAAIRAT